MAVLELSVDISDFEDEVRTRGLAVYSQEDYSDLHDHVALHLIVARQTRGQVVNFLKDPSSGS